MINDFTTTGLWNLSFHSFLNYKYLGQAAEAAKAISEGPRGPYPCRYFFNILQNMFKITVFNIKILNIYIVIVSNNRLFVTDE